MKTSRRNQFIFYMLVGFALTLHAFLALAGDLEHAKKAHDDKDYVTAVKLYEKSALAGDATAQFTLGTWYEIGRGVEQNDEKAVYWYRKAADQVSVKSAGNTLQIYQITAADPASVRNAQDRLGLMYELGKGVRQDYKQAAFWYQQAPGLPVADFHLGLLYQDGRGVAQSYQGASFFYERAAKKGLAAAQYSLGIMCDFGLWSKQDFKQAAYWYQKAADQKLASAQYRLGLLYEHGRGVPQSSEQALSLYQKSADQGYQLARSQLVIVKSETLKTCDGNDNEDVASDERSLPLKPGLWTFHTDIKSMHIDKKNAAKRSCTIEKSLCIKEHTKLSEGKFWVQTNNNDSPLLYCRDFNVTDTESLSEIITKCSGFVLGSVRQIRTKYSENQYDFKSFKHIGANWHPDAPVMTVEVTKEMSATFAGVCPASGS